MKEQEKNPKEWKYIKNFNMHKMLWNSTVSDAIFQNRNAKSRQYCQPGQHKAVLLKLKYGKCNWKVTPQEEIEFCRRLIDNILNDNVGVF